MTVSFFFLVGFKVNFLSVNGDWAGVVAAGVGIRVGISCGWDCANKLLLVFIEVKENIFNGELISRRGWEVVPNGSTWKVELVAGG